MTFNLPELGFATDALEPFMDKETVEIHHGKHHAGYTAKLNAALKESGLEQVSLESEVFTQTSNLPASIVINGGQFWNHSFFWESLAVSGQVPTGDLMNKITESFGGYEQFVEQFTSSATAVFGSGWTWLCQKEDGSLALVNTVNHENPLFDSVVAKEGKMRPLMVIDVWEHAYYLKYQNRRPEFIAAFLQIVNWEKVSERMV